MTTTTNQKQTLVDNIIRERHSVYPQNFAERPVEREIVESLLQNAVWAPTHKHTEPWRFRVFSGKGVKTFFERMKEIYRETTPEEEFKPAKLEKWDRKAEQVSHVIAIGMMRDPEERVPEIEEIAAVACAVQNIYLSLEAYGVAGYWGTGKISETDHMKQFLELGEKDRCMGFFYLGYPADDAGTPLRKRKPLEEVTTWIDGE